jgi:uncharacterized protein
MGRLIVLIVLVVVAVWLLRRAVAPRAPRHTPAAGGASAEAPGGELVRCAHCGTYLPHAEAKRAGDLLYCTEDHARLGPRKP